MTNALGYLKEWIAQAQADKDFIEAENVQLKARVAHLEETLGLRTATLHNIARQCDALRMAAGEGIGGGIDLSRFTVECYIRCTECGSPADPCNHVCGDGS